MSTTRPFEYRARDAASLLEQMRARIPELLPEWTGHESESDVGNVLLQLFAHMGDILGYYTDAAANESFLSTAQTRRAVIDHLRLIGYRLSTAAPASATLTLSIVGPCTGPVTVRRGDAFATKRTKDTPSVRFEYARDDDLIIACDDFVDVGNGTLRAVTPIPVVQGRLAPGDVVGVSDGTAGQRFALTHAPLILRPLGAAQDTTADLQVRSEAGSAITAWHLRDSLAFSGPEATDVAVEIDAQDRAELVFGTAVPPAGAQVRATYRVGGGQVGNVAGGTIRTIADAPELSLLGATVVNDRPATGGADRETIAHAVRSAPTAFRSMGRAVTTADYEALALELGGVGKVRAAAAGWNTVILYVAPSGGGTVSDVLAADLIAHFEDKRPVGTRVEVHNVVYVPVFITAEVDVDAYYPTTRVTEQVRAAITGILAFERVRFGERVYLSKVYEAVEAITGVAGATVTEFRGPEQAATVHPEGKLTLGARELARIPTTEDFALHPAGADPDGYPGGVRVLATGGFQ